MTLPNPPTAHDRTVVTITVILAGTVLLYSFGDNTSIVALVSAMWTLTLTFWFRFGSDI